MALRCVISVHRYCSSAVVCYLFEVVLGLMMLVGGLAEVLLEGGMPVMQLILRHLGILRCQAALHFGNDALPGAQTRTRCMCWLALGQSQFCGVFASYIS